MGLRAISSTVSISLMLTKHFLLSSVSFCNALKHIIIALAVLLGFIGNPFLCYNGNQDAAKMPQQGTYQIQYTVKRIKLLPDYNHLSLNSRLSMYRWEKSSQKDLLGLIGRNVALLVPWSWCSYHTLSSLHNKRIVLT